MRCCYLLQKDYNAAEVAYSAVVDYGEESRFYEQSLYKLGWSQFKLAWHEDSLEPFFELLDRKIGAIELKEGEERLASLSRAEQELVEDTFRVLSISFSYMDGAKAIDEFLARRGHPQYAYVIYMNLGDLYLNKERFVDAAETYEAFVGQDPYHKKAPLLQVEVIEAYKRGGFPSLVLEGKKGFVDRYGMDGEFWVRNPREENTEVAAHLKANLTDLAQYYHAEAQTNGKQSDYREAANWYRKYLAYFPGEPDTANTNFLLAEILFESEEFAEATIEYERTAYGYPLHEHSAEAGYAALLAYAEHERALSGEEKIAWHQQYLDSGLRFAETYPEHPESGAVLTTVAEDLFAQNQFDLAIAVGQTVVGKQPAVEPALARTAWTVIAHSQFDLAQFAEAEQSYYQLRAYTPADDAGRTAGDQGPDIDGAEVVHRPDEETGADRQHDRERELDAGEPAQPERSPAPAQRAPGARAQNRGQPRPTVHPHRQRPEGETDEQRQPGGEADHRPAQAHAAEAGKLLRGESRQVVQGDRREPEAGDRAERAEHERLAQVLPTDRAPARPERGAHRHLGRAPVRTDHDERRDVHAAHEQHDHDATEEQPEQIARVSDDPVLQGLDERVEGKRVHRVRSTRLRVELPREGQQARDVRRGILAGGAVTKSRHAPVADVHRGPDRLRSEAERQHELGLDVETVDRGRGHADDFSRLTVDRQRAPHGGRIRPEAVDPVPLGEHHRPGREAVHLLGREAPPGDGREGQSGQEIETGEEHGHRLGLSHAGDRDVPVRVHRERLEGPTVLRVGEVPCRALTHVVHAARRGRVTETHQPVRVLERQRPEHDRVEERENRHRGPDSDREHEDRRAREDGLAHERAHRPPNTRDTVGQPAPGLPGAAEPVLPAAEPPVGAGTKPLRLDRDQLPTYALLFGELLLDPRIGLFGTQAPEHRVAMQVLQMIGQLVDDPLVPLPPHGGQVDS